MPIRQAPVPDVLGDLAHALRTTDMTWPRNDDEDFLDNRALAWSRCRDHLPDWPDHTELPEPQRHQLIQDFATDSGRDDPVSRSLAELLVDYGEGYIGAGPLCWSPGEVMLAPIRLRIGVHTGEIQLRDEDNYAGPTINRTARLRDLAHGGQTVLSGATEAMVVDRLPPEAWLTDLGTHPLRDLPRPERVVQLCHPDLRNDFPPLRTTSTVVSHNLPMQLTSFVGRGAHMTDLEKLLVDNRLVTLTGAGGAGKTRLAVEVAARIAADFRDGMWYVDLAPVTHPGVVPVTVARALGLPDQPGRSTMDTLLRFVRDRQMLVVANMHQRHMSVNWL